MDDEIGGFWAGLRLKPDQASFAAGERALNGIAGGLKKIAALVVSGAVVKEITRLAEAQSRLNMTAAFADIDTDQLTRWTMMLHTAGLNADAFVGSLTDLNNQFLRMQFGDALSEQTAKSMALLGLDVSKMRSASSENRAESILTAADKYAKKTGDARAAAQLVKDLLGDAGSQYFMWLELSGKSLSSQMQMMKGLQFTNKLDTKNVMEAVADLNTLKETFNSMASQFAQKLMFKVDPAFKELLSYIVKHKDEINLALSSFADLMGGVAIAMVQIAGVAGGFLQAATMKEKKYSPEWFAKGQGIYKGMEPFMKSILGDKVWSFFNDYGGWREKSAAGGSTRMTHMIDMTPAARRLFMIDIGRASSETLGVAGGRSVRR